MDQAMDLIIKVTGEFKGNRQDHALITQALEVINQAIYKESHGEVANPDQGDQ